ncbi:Taste receptor type 2 member 45, partial [Myotis brandtii]
LKVRIVKDSRPIILYLAFFFSDMIHLLPSILSILIIAQYVLGSFANGFIALVNCIDWVKKHKISCADRILTALAFSRICLLWIIIFNWYGTVLHPAIYSSEVKTIVHIAWVASNHFSLWLATSLSILYLLKIANFSCLLFLHLKWRAERVVIMILWGTSVFLVFHLAVVGTDEKMKMNVYKGNITWESKLRDITHLSNGIIFVLVHFIPFTTSLTAVLLLIFSMWKHLKKMQVSGKGSQDPSTEVHIRAMQTVISFLLLFVIYFFAQIISFWNFSIMQNNSVPLLCQVFGILYPSSHSFILIWGNKKLRQAFLSLLRQLRCWLKERR